jgi:hypothetical protein
MNNRTGACLPRQRQAGVFHGLPQCRRGCQGLFYMGCRSADAASVSGCRRKFDLKFTRTLQKPDTNFTFGSLPWWRLPFRIPYNKKGKMISKKILRASDT